MVLGTLRTAVKRWVCAMRGGVLYHTGRGKQRTKLHCRAPPRAARGRRTRPRGRSPEKLPEKLPDNAPHCAALPARPNASRRPRK